MSLETLELIAWDLDSSPHRPVLPSQPTPPTRGLPPEIVLDPTTKLPDFTSILNRSDLHEEFAGLDWTLSVVDLRTLQAFQRRLHFDFARPRLQIDPEALLSVAFPPPRSVAHTRSGPNVLQSENPDLTLRPTATGWQLYGGSPFLEVALFHDRAFLRDGYHRAYDLLRAGIHIVPAVVLRARSLDEIYPQTSNFFPPSTLFGTRPPLVADFLDPVLTLTYPTPRVLKTLRVHIEETFEPLQKEHS